MKNAMACIAMSSLVTATLLLAGCGSQDIEKAKKAVASRLKDPESANFRNVEIYRDNGSVTVCGEVNSKNGFGGYGEYSRFMWDGEGEPIFKSDWERMNAGWAFEDSWASDCRQGS